VEGVEVARGGDPRALVVLVERHVALRVAASVLLVVV
jgi:hypothetical protein